MSFFAHQNNRTMLDMIKKLQQAKAEMDKIKERLEGITVEGVSPNSAIKVRVNGNRKVKGIEIASSDVMDDKDMLEDHLVIAMNDALEKTEKVNESEMRSAASTMMPGLGGMFGG